MALNLKRPKDGNVLSPAFVEILSEKVKLSKDSHIIGVLIITAEADDKIFCLGVDPVLYDEDRVASIEPILKIKSLFTIDKNKPEQFPTNMFASYCGIMNGTGFAAFSTAKYRINTPESEMTVNELFEGRLPLGGFAHFIVNKCDSGVAVSISVYV